MRLCSWKALPKQVAPVKLTSVPVLQGMAWTLAEPIPAKELVFSAFFGFKKKKKICCSVSDPCFPDNTYYSHA